MTNSPRALQANSRGIAVLVTAVVVGFLLLVQAGASGGGGSGKDEVVVAETTTTEADTPTPTDPDGTTADTTGDTTDDTTNNEDPDGTDDEGETSDVRVAVLNASGVTGLAATTMATVVDAGYAEGAVGNATATDTTGIFYREGYQAEATALASLFGKPDSIVAALSTPFAGTTEDDVVIVVLGTDFEG